MPEPLTLHVLVAHLDDSLRTQRHERQVLSGVPARSLALTRCALTSLVGCPVPRVPFEVRYKRLKFDEQLLAPRHRERTDDADRHEYVAAVQPQHQRADRV